VTINGTNGDDDIKIASVGSKTADVITLGQDVLLGS